MLKIADGIDGAVKLALRLQLAADFDAHRLDCNQQLLLNVVKPLIRKYFYF